MLAAALLLTALGPLASSPPAPLPPAAEPALQAGKASDPLERVRKLLPQFRDPRREPSPEAVADLQILIAELRMIQASIPDRRREVFLVLLDLAALHPERPASAGELRWSPPSWRDEIGKHAYEALGRALDLDRDGDVMAWIASSILAQPQAHSALRRRVVLELLAGRREPELQLAIMSSALDPDRDVREAAMRALVGWADEGVHRLMLMQLARTRTSPDWIQASLVQRHFGSLSLAKDSPAARAVFDFVRTDLLAQDWRDAVRALRLLGTVDDSLAVPALIEALSVWIGRREQGAGRRRIEDEIHRQLKARSKRSIGPYPERWATWWRVHGSGALPADLDGPQQATRAGFFGLRPVTDRVTFILDRSGSMATGFGQGGSRYHEAIRQLVQFLRELGPGTRFRVVLFGSEVDVWKDKLVPAGEDELASAQQWVSYHHPEGGTLLRPSVEHVLRLEPDGGIDLARIEEDTVIVLCDGATTDGSGWVRRLFERVGDQACVAFHCVQIGGGSDGTLELLAELTGGQFVRVDG